VQIRKLLTIFLSLGIALAATSVVMAFLLERALLEVEDAQERRHASYLLADELRQSSDDLTRFARTFVMSGDENYKRYFKAAIDIRDGKLERPEGYESIYWDLVIGGELPEPSNTGNPTPSLESRMLHSDFTVEEFSTLKDSQNRSDELVGLENVAMNAVAGRFDDGTGAFEKRGEPDKELAAQLLHGERYHKAKAEIMAPIGAFLKMVDTRTYETLNGLNRRAYRLLVGILAIATALVACLGIMTWILRRRLIQRTQTLVQTAEQVTAGNLDARSGLRGNDELGQLSESIDDMIERLSNALGDANARTQESMERSEELDTERKRSDKLLHNILPSVIAGRLKKGESTIAETYPEVTVLFADIVGFTQLSDRIGPRQIVSMLNDVFGRFDGIAEKHSVEKIKTIGDCYMVVGGVPERSATHCQQIAEFGLDALASFREYAKDFGEPLQVRIGIHTGTVVAGVVGTQKFSFDLWGDVVNVASRMESSGLPDRIHVSDGVQIRLADDYQFEDRGITDLKGKGTMHTWFLESRRHAE
jgi:class 3 adenylate cyclase/HAMP domain-containing protein